jgi:uncharacterized protein involved in exopolysaccharide biosynthesis
MTSADEQAMQEEHAQEQNRTVLALVTGIALRKRRIIALALLGAVLGLTLGMLKKPYYIAQTVLLPPSLAHPSFSSAMQQNTTLGAFGLGGGGLAGLAMKTQADSFAVLLSAWPIRDALVKRFHLMEEYHSHSEQAARDRFGSTVAIAATKEGFIGLSVQSRDPKQAAAIANAYVEEARAYLKGMALTEASQRRLFYERELAESKEKLSQAEVDFKAMQQQSHIISVDSQAKALIDSAATLQAEITAREVELQRLRSYSTDNNPQVQLAETELSALRGQLSKMESSSKGDGFTDTPLSNVPAAELNFVRATRELKYQEGLYDILVRQYEASKIDEASDAPVIQVISPAYAPERKAGPHRVIFLAIGFGVGLLFGLVWATVGYWRSQLTPEGRAQVRSLRRALIG